MPDFSRLSDEELARRGRQLVRNGQYSLGNQLLTEYCSRLAAKGEPIGSSIMATYGLSIGMTGNVREGLETCQQALSVDRRNAEIWAAIGRLSIVAGSRKKAVEAIDRGLSLAPRSRELLALRQQLGSRGKPPLPFLQRDNPVNVRLGRVLHRLRAGKRRTKPA